MTLKSRSLSAQAPKSTAITDMLIGLSQEELLVLRRKIDLALKTDLTRLDLAEELGLQYRQGMVLMDSIADDVDVPANHRATALTSVSNVLSKIISDQKIVYNAERTKRFEAAFLKVLNLQKDVEGRRVFFDLYSEFLKEDSEAGRAAEEKAT